MKRLLLLVIICISSVSFGQLNVGLIAQYDFSGDALDVSGNNYHGVVNGATLVNDRDGNQSSAYMFDGVDNSIEVTGFPTNFSNYSYCAWVKYADTAVPSGIVNQTSIQSSTGDTMSGFGIHHSGAGNDYSLRGRHRDGTGLYIGNYHEISDFNWHFYVSTFDGDTLKLFVDGSFEIYTLVNSSDSKTSQLLIGSGRTQAIPLGFFFNGIIDDIRIYNRELTDCEITELYTGQACNVGISELSSQPKELIRIVNLLGQEVEYTPNTVLIYQYADGTSEKVFTIED